MTIESPASRASSHAAEGSGAAPASQALYSVATSFDAGTEPRAILAELVRRAAAAARARSAWLLTADAAAGPPAVAAAWPDPAEPPPQPDGAKVLAFPLLHTGSAVGILLLADPAAGAFGPADRRTAAALARPAAAVAAVALRLGAAEESAHRAAEAAALQKEVVAAVDHDLRTPLTSILGALQTLARPEQAPADPDLAALLASALGQAQRLRALLGDLQLASSSIPRREALLPDALGALIAEAARAGMGGAAAVPIEIPAGFPAAVADPPALRRVLGGVLRRACRLGHAARVEVAAWGDDALIAVTAGGPGPLVPDLSARLAAAMGARLEESTSVKGNAVVQLVLPGALSPVPADRS
jgi:signal transduction histidine kinase